jgi:hypothetical protein
LLPSVVVRMASSFVLVMRPCQCHSPDGVQAVGVARPSPQPLIAKQCHKFGTPVCARGLPTCAARLNLATKDR